ncbi:hypothetical protein ENSA5_07640 [Enhygromyxa salina]|uniref:Uncharacterized protein n=1 Tax=Enhygromyxa salina TaxID=215803 RepID=A0A2S9YH41_9BACT|nr:hypothetical protein [Enhygromyxa salina]PRQ04428.1 hypothetical protein ENSA5_07640 [Enhygromyxa salina]
MTPFNANLNSIMDTMSIDTERLPDDRDPWAIASDPRLEIPLKLRRLRQLEYDVRQALVASEEGMDGGPRLPALGEVLAAIAHVGPRAEPSSSPTKF